MCTKNYYKNRINYADQVYPKNKSALGLYQIKPSYSIFQFYLTLRLFLTSDCSQKCTDKSYGTKSVHIHISVVNIIGKYKSIKITNIL